MIPKIEHIGQASSSSWARRVRRFLSELFGSKYEQFLEREIVQQRIEKDRTISELRADRDRLLEALMAAKGIPLRSVPTQRAETQATAPPLPTKWQQIVAAEQQKIAREEEQEQAKEN